MIFLLVWISCLLLLSLWLGLWLCLWLRLCYREQQLENLDIVRPSRFGRGLVPKGSKVLMNISAAGLCLLVPLALGVWLICGY